MTMKDAKDGTYITSDLPIAAWLKMKGFRLIDARRTDRGQFMFEFEDVDGAAHFAAVDFINSCCSKFDAEIRNLKKLLYNR